ncbi:XrtA/PEP-CTERM system TPR-repeat protein PrsT [Thalassotalea sp. Y01]|uniref:XrtA/PEP-CTERM system TPR-repeat protein PrsT n=1 Tax=Thalassotalea sp. Y01 TaxID=2729613 RepID=UPI00145C5B5D|nr:XrtA/PEP-CTERM system TPR-repeat protein PrsT [Thalassotalea sp. Y01]NMP16179.1 PEP-CTERM system TPR-repeat protein PrsT [Thalassotalea sp. Y01]
MLKTLKPALLVAALVACSGQKTADEYVQSALAYIEQNEVSAAIVELKNAIQLEPKSNDARFILAQMYMQTGNFDGAEKEFQRSLDNGFDINRIMILQVRIALLKAESDRVLEWTNDERVAQLHPEKKTELLAVAGIGLTYLSRFNDGFELLARVMKEGTEDSVYFTMAKAWMAANEGQKKEAIEEIKPLVSQDNSFDDVKILLANLYALDDNAELAAAELKPILDRHGNNIFVRLLYVNMLVKSGELEEAKMHTSSLLKMSPTSPSINELKAEISLREGKYKEAAEYATIALTSMPSLHKANLIAGISHYKTDNMEMAYHHLAQIENRLPKTHVAQQVLTQVKLRLGYIDDAIANIDTVNSLSPSDFATLANASVELLRSGDKDKARDYIKRLENIEGDDPEMMSRRGSLKLSVEDDSGIKDLNNALKIDPNMSEARLALIYHYMQSDNNELAMVEADRWIEEVPDSEGGYLARGVVWREMGQPEKAKQAFEQALLVKPDSMGAHFNLAQLNNRLEQYDLALVHVEKVLARNPEHRGALRTAVNMAPKVDDDKIIDFLTQLSQDNPDSLTIAIARAQAYDNIGQEEQALQQLERLQTQFDDDPRLLSALAKVAIRSEDFVKAEQTFAKLVKVSPRDFTAQLGLLMALENQGKNQQAYTEVKKAQEIFPNAAMLKFFEVNFLYKTKSYREAEKRLANIDPKTLEPKPYWALSTKIQSRLQQWDKAAHSAANWYEVDKGFASASSYARVLQKTGNHQKAMQVARQAQIDHGDNAMVQGLLAELQLEQDPATALQYYQRMATKSPDNFAIQNNLAWAAIQANDLELGLGAAQKAAKLAPENPHVLDTLAYAYMRNGEYKQADLLMRRVQEELPNNEEVKIHYAELLVHLKKFDQAKKLLDSISDSEDKQQVVRLYETNKG